MDKVSIEEVFKKYFCEQFYSESTFPIFDDFSPAELNRINFLLEKLSETLSKYRKAIALIWKFSIELNLSLKTSKCIQEGQKVSCLQTLQKSPITVLDFHKMVLGMTWTSIP